MPIIRGGTSRGAHVKGLYEALTVLIEDLPDVPSEKRVRLRTVRAGLVRAYPELRQEVDLEHMTEDPDEETL